MTRRVILAPSIALALAAAFHGCTRKTQAPRPAPGASSAAAVAEPAALEAPSAATPTEKAKEVEPSAAASKLPAQAPQSKKNELKNEPPPQQQQGGQVFHMPAVRNPQQPQEAPSLPDPAHLEPTLPPRSGKKPERPKLGMAATPGKTPPPLPAPSPLPSPAPIPSGMRPN